jgi:flagellar basal body-associated protein FliL
MAEATAPAVKPTVPQKRNIALVALGVLNLLGLLGVGGYVLVTRGQAARPGEHGDAGGHGEDEASDDEGEDEEHEGTMGPVVEFESMVVNLREPSTDRYLKLTFEIEAASEEAVEHIEQRMPRFRDRVLMHLTALTLDDVRGSGNATVLRDHLLEMGREVFGRRNVRRIYMTEYLVQ